MPIAFHPRSRVDKRNSLGPTYYAALYEDEPLEPGVFTEATMPGRGTLSYPDPFGDASGEDAIPRTPIFTSGFDTDESALINQRNPWFSGVGIDALPDTGNTLARGILTEAPMYERGILSYPGAFDSAAGRDAAATHPIPASSLVPAVDTDAAQETGPGEEHPGAQAVFSPMGDVFFQESANSAAPAGKSTIGHAGDWESLIPFWGAGRNLLADLDEGNYASAAINAGLLASDFFLWGAPAKFIFKAGQFGYKKSGIKGAAEGIRYSIKGPGKITAKDKWRSARDKMKRRGMVPEKHGIEYEGHHIIPQAGFGKGGWGRNLPDAIMHHPLNIKWLPKEQHQRLHRKWKELPEFTVPEKIWYWSPRWSKALTGEVVGRGNVPSVRKFENWLRD